MTASGRSFRAPSRGLASWLPFVPSLLVACGGATTIPEPVGIVAFGECDASGISRIVLAAPDGSGRRQLTRGEGHDWFPAFSPDGRQILFTHESQGRLEVWLMDAEGGNAHAIATDGINLAASWSPDGTMIAYAHAPRFGTGLKIWIANVDGTHRRPLTGATASDVDENVPRWSPDSRRLVFTSNRRGGRYEIWTADAANGGNLRVLTSAYFDAAFQATIEQKVPAWSPDGRHIAFWAGVEATDPRPSLPRAVWVMNADGSEQKRLVGGDDPNWSPDGAAIIHSTSEGGSPALGAVDRDGTSPRILFSVRACRPLQSSWFASR
jgi:TolB protein